MALFQVARNSVIDGTTSNVVELLYFNHNVYYVNASSVWFEWNGTSWVQQPHDPRAVESTQGATVTNTTGIIYDQAITPWTLVQSTTLGLQVAHNGVVSAATSNVSLLLYFNHTVYYQNASGSWFLWSGAAWTPTTDPRTVSGSVPGIPVGLAGSPAGATAVTLSWSPPTSGGGIDAGGYVVQQRRHGTTPFTNTTIPVCTPGKGNFTDPAGHVWSISPGQVITVDGTPDTTTSNVTQLLMMPSGTIWQQNTAGNWYSKPNVSGIWSSATTVSPLSAVLLSTGFVASTEYDFQVFAFNTTGNGNATSVINVTTSAAGTTGQFSIVNGNIMRGGTRWRCRGVDNYFIDQNGSGNVADFATINGVFPGLNTFKACLLAHHTYADVKPFIDDWTGHGCVIIIANYIYGAEDPINSGNFAADAATFADIAANTKDNPLVWFESCNEPQDGNVPISSDHVNTYNAVRNTGNNNLVLFCFNSGNPAFGYQGGQIRQNPALYANMFNIVFDDHWYGAGYTIGNNNWGTIPIRMNVFANIRSRDGQVPVGSFEWGDAYAGANGPHNFGTRGGGPQEGNVIQCLKDVCNASLDNGQLNGFAGMTAWEYGNYGVFGGDVLQNNNQVYIQSDHYGEIIAFCCAHPTTRQ